MTTGTSAAAFTDFARVELTLLEPLSIGSGEADDVTDALPFRDANGLPAISGATLAGVWRSLVRRTRCAHCAAREFGNDPNAAGDLRKSPTRSRVRLSFAHVVGKDRRTRQTLICGSDTDDVIAALRAGTVVRRDHVRIDERGAVDGEGKFNRDAIPAGVTFRFQIERPRAADETQAEFDDLLRLLHHPLFRLGGASRRGYGAVAVTVRTVSFDRRITEERTQLARLRGDLDGKLPDHARPIDSPGSWPDLLLAGLTLRPEAFWLIGSDQPPIGGDVTMDEDGKALRPHHTPYRETVLENDRWEERIVVPESSLKGPLRHRTLFHYRRLGWIAGVDPRSPPAKEAAAVDAAAMEAAAKAKEAAAKAKEAAAKAMAALFGEAKPGRGDGRQGVVLFDRVTVAAQARKIIHHNVIDRFTLGVMNEGLFAEQALYRGAIAMRLVLDLHAVPESRVRHAFLAALEDLTQGRLSIGAGAADGHGFCEGCWEQGADVRLAEWAGDDNA